MGDPVALSLVVVAYHRPVALDHFLAGLGSHAGLDLVVVVVEGDPEVAAVAERHGARCLLTSDNPGFATCVNRGVALVHERVVVFGNDDLAASRADLDALVAPVLAGTCDVAVPQIRDADGEPERTIAALPTVGALLREWMLLPDAPVRALTWLRVEKWRTPSVPERISAATAALVAVRTDLIRGEPLPEAYFLYWEEQEWFWRLDAQHAVVHYRPEVQVTHGGGRVDVRPDKSRLMARNAVRCVRRTQGRWQAALAWPIVVVWNLRLLAVDGARSVTGRGEHTRVAARRAGLAAAPRAWREVR